jgi:transposase
MEKYSVRQFNEDFPDDDACLAFVELIYPDGITCRACEAVTKHHKLERRKAYSCQKCGTHVSPLAGTIFEKSSTSLKSWFYAMWIMGSTRCGISAKQLERELGVTYKTAWRMFTQIRKLLDEGPDLLGDAVEIDETYVGGRMRYPAATRQEAALRRGENKTPVLGMVERGGKVQAMKVPDASRETVLPLVQERVLPASMIYTDEHKSYARLDRMGYQHRRIHHASKVWVMGDVHTNTIEGFWSLFKRSISGAHHAISEKYLQSYLDEWVFRYNHRRDQQAMQKTFMQRVARVRAGKHGEYSPVGE